MRTEAENAKRGEIVAFPFRMAFTGLCALVPNTNGVEGRVLLVNAGTASGVKHAHVPWLRYRGHKYSLAGTEVTLNLTNPNPATLRLFQPPLPPPTPPFAHRPTPQTDEERSVHWIAELSAAIAPLKPTCFDARRPTFITSRIKLTAGHLSTSRIIEDPLLQGTVVTLGWGLFDSLGNPVPNFHQVIAAQFQLNALIDGGHIVISPGPPQIPLLAAAGEALVEVGNTCSCVDTFDPLEDFSWFFDLTTATIIFLPSRTGGGATDTMCPPAKFPANPLA